MRGFSRAMVREACPVLGHGLCERMVLVWVIETPSWRGLTCKGD